MKKLLFIVTISILFLLQACSGNSFHLRKELDLPVKYQYIQIKNLSYDNDFVRVFEVSLEESGGKLLEDTMTSLAVVPTTKIEINNFRERKRVIAYTKERKAREYLLSLKFEYIILPASRSKYRVNLDRVFIYDSDFALGKAEEEQQIRQDLYAEAARLILLRLQYAKN